MPSRNIIQVGCHTHTRIGSYLSPFSLSVFPQAGFQELRLVSRALPKATGLEFAGSGHGVSRATTQRPLARNAGSTRTITMDSRVLTIDSAQ